MEIKNKIVSLIIALLLCAMVYSSFMQSLCMMALVVVGFLDFHSTSEGTQVRWTWLPFQRLRSISKYSHFLVITLYFWIVLFSFWHVDGDYNYFLERLRIKVPFLLIPLAYLGLPSLSSLAFKRILYYFMALMTISVVGVLSLYIFNFEEVNLLLKKGQHMATPCNHIRFSQLVAIAVIAAWYLIKENFSASQSLHSTLIKIMAIILFVSIHILSVKTGILCLYVALFVLAIRHVYVTRKYITGVVIMISIVLLPLVAYKTIPSFAKKVDYTLYDLQMYGEGKGSNYGDSGRITSMKVGIELFKESPLLGVGAGNLKDEVNKYFMVNYPRYPKPLMPHNQFLFVLAGSGIIGISLFLIAFWIPLIYKQAYRNDFYLGFYILFLISFTIEHTIENALGVGIFSSFILIGLLHSNNRNSIKK